MSGKLLLKLQKRQINGPFKRVTYIDPYPEKIWKFPSFLQSNLLLYFGVLLVLVAFCIGFAGAGQKVPNWSNSGFAQHIATVIHQQISVVSEITKAERSDVVIFFIVTFIICGVCSVALSGWLSKRLVIRKWKCNCEKTTTKVLDYEIQTINLYKDAEDNKPKTRFEIRFKVEFTYRGETIVATPSVVNRLVPGSIGVHYNTYEECEKRAQKCNGSIDIEFNPKQPKDCELKDNLALLLEYDTFQWIYVLFFCVVVVLFGWAFSH